MRIKRLQVEDGFLDRLDLEFHPNLNVIIGSRGTGKTSIIELIRFCLNAPSQTDSWTRRSREHAISILKSGRVTVTLEDNGTELEVTRSVEDQAPRTTKRVEPPIIFAQREIELVGLEAPGRLNLIDGFIKSAENPELSEKTIISKVRSISEELASVREKVDEYYHEASARNGIEDELKALAPEEERLGQMSSEISEKQKEIDGLSKSIEALEFEAGRLEHIRSNIIEWSNRISVESQSIPETSLGEGEGAKRISSELRSDFERISLDLQRISERVLSLTAQLTNRLELVEAQRILQSGRFRTLRQELDRLHEGAGEITQKGHRLRQQLARAMRMEDELGKLQTKEAELVAKRNQELSDLESLRRARFLKREAVAQKLSHVLGPRIRVRVLHAGQIAQYETSLINLFRGSGLKYTDIVPMLAAELMPRELLEAVELHDTDRIVASIGVTQGRASRLLSQLRDVNDADLACIMIDDDIKLELLDGDQYKDFLDLSTGQKCTVVLPIILQHKDHPIILDQPEDHIDNAFIVDTLIKGVRDRGSEQQIIISTHNPNIPVLGEADRVIQLDSNGYRGFVKISSSLFDEAVVEVISNLMEGGAEAFARRADYYAPVSQK